MNLLLIHESSFLNKKIHQIINRGQIYIQFTSLYIYFHLRKFEQVSIQNDMEPARSNKIESKVLS